VRGRADRINPFGSTILASGAAWQPGGGRIQPDEVSAEMKRALADFREFVASASAHNLRQVSHGTRWTNRQLLFHMVLGYVVVRTLLPLVRILGRLGHSRGFAATLTEPIIAGLFSCRR
jgi:hypothetical protein